jgi:hypothetical protein
VLNWLYCLHKAIWPRNLFGSLLNESKPNHAAPDSAGLQNL